MGAAVTRPSLRPLFSTRVVEWKNSDRACRENADSHPSTRHAPRIRGIQYAVASPLKHSRLWNTGSPPEPVIGRRYAPTRWRGRRRREEEHYAKPAPMQPPYLSLFEN